ncbi:hypothetical protein [Nonlabens sp. Asnod2-A12]|uniref:hypothetical protein n=1 Tax=Nonlabens sp. Asnod2-A12 TaxID=3160578 RepID=UPI00386407E4
MLKLNTINQHTAIFSFYVLLNSISPVFTQRLLRNKKSYYSLIFSLSLLTVSLTLFSQYFTKDYEILSKLSIYAGIFLLILSTLLFDDFCKNKAKEKTENLEDKNAKRLDTLDIKTESITVELNNMGSDLYATIDLSNRKNTQLETDISSLNKKVNSKHLEQINNVKELKNLIHSENSKLETDISSLNKKVNSKHLEQINNVKELKNLIHSENSKLETDISSLNKKVNSKHLEQINNVKELKNLIHSENSKLETDISSLNKNADSKHLQQIKNVKALKNLVHSKNIKLESSILIINASMMTLKNQFLELPRMYMNKTDEKLSIIEANSIVEKGFPEFYEAVKKLDYFDRINNKIRFEDYPLTERQAYQTMIVYFQRKYELPANAGKTKIYDLFNENFKIRGGSLSSDNWNGFKISHLPKIDSNCLYQHLFKDLIMLNKTP